MARKAKILRLDLHSLTCNQLHYLDNCVPIDTQIQVKKFHRGSPDPRAPADSVVRDSTSLCLFTSCEPSLWARNIDTVLPGFGRNNEFVSDTTLLTAG